MPQTSYCSSKIQYQPQYNRTESTDYLTISGFTSLNGLICLHSVLDKAWLSVGFQTHLKSSHFHSFIHSYL